MATESNTENNTENEVISQDVLTDLLLAGVYKTFGAEGLKIILGDKS